MDAMSYWLGFLTLPALYFAGCIALGALVPNGGRKECGVCGYQAGQSVPLARWFTWQWHRFAIFPRRWHKQALAIWRIERGRDPLTGALEPTTA